MTKAACRACSICGRSFPLNEFSYGNREGRSYWKACSKAESRRMRKVVPSRTSVQREYARQMETLTPNSALLTNAYCSLVRRGKRGR